LWVVRLTVFKQNRGQSSKSPCTSAFEGEQA
jgi:hypothetical protein